MPWSVRLVMKGSHVTIANRVTQKSMTPIPIATQILKIHVVTVWTASVQVGSGLDMGSPGKVVARTMHDKVVNSAGASY